MTRRKSKAMSHSGGLFSLPTTSPSPTSQVTSSIHPIALETPTDVPVLSPLGGDSTLTVPTIDAQTAGAKRKREDGDNTGDGEWQIVTRKKSKKLPRSDSNSYPAIVFAPGQAKLSSKIKTSDLRDLVIYILADGHPPQWVAVKHRTQFRKVVVLYIPGLEESLFKEKVDLATFVSPRPTLGPDTYPHTTLTSPDDYYPRPLDKNKLPEELKPFADMFPALWPVTAPGDSRHGRLHSPVAAFLTTQPSKREKEIAKARKLSNWRDVRTPITSFLVTQGEMLHHGYPMHPAFLDEEERESFVPTEGYCYTPVESLRDGDVPEDEIEEGSMTAGRDVFAIDCEMVQTGSERTRDKALALARISIITWSGDRVMDKFVKPEAHITDYVTRWSGITPALLENVTTTLSDIQEELKQIISPRAILVGHSLESDLKAMKFSHPFLVDTSILYPHNNGLPHKNKLKDLAWRFNKRQIQTGYDGHDSLEDALASLELVQLKCQKGRDFGVPENAGVNMFLRLQNLGTVNKANGDPPVAGSMKKGKKTAIVDWNNETMRTWGRNAEFKISCVNDSEVEAGVLRAVKGDPDGREIPGGGVDFVFARLRELEKLRGWDRHPGYQDPHLVEAQKSPIKPQPQPSVGSEQDKEETRRSPLAAQLHALSSSIKRIHDALPPCTAFMVFSGQGNALEQQHLFAKQAKWNSDETSGMPLETRQVKWTKEDEQALLQSTKTARQGIGFVGVK